MVFVKCKMVSVKILTFVKKNTRRMKPHKNLNSWIKSFEFVKEIYLITRQFPPEEKFGITSQIRRASVSVPVNIAEGAARKGTKEFIHFLHISLGLYQNLIL